MAVSCNIYLAPVLTHHCVLVRGKKYPMEFELFLEPAVLWLLCCTICWRSTYSESRWFVKSFGLYVSTAIQGVSRYLLSVMLS